MHYSTGRVKFYFVGSTAIGPTRPHAAVARHGQRLAAVPYRTAPLASVDDARPAMPKATAVFDADDSRLSGALARINGQMLALQSRIAKFAAAFIAVRAVRQ